MILFETNESKSSISLQEVDFLKVIDVSNLTFLASIVLNTWIKLYAPV